MTVSYEIPDNDTAKSDASKIIARMTEDPDDDLRVVAVSHDNEFNKLAVIEDAVEMRTGDIFTIEEVLKDPSIGDATTVAEWSENNN